MAAGDDDSDDEAIEATPALLLALLARVPPDITLREFVDGSDPRIDRESLGVAIATAISAGIAEVVGDELNDPVVCLTAYGAGLAGVKLSPLWPPEWVPEAAEDPPPFDPHPFADNVYVATDLEVVGVDGDVLDFFDAIPDPRVAEPIEVPCEVETARGELGRRGDPIPKARHLTLHGIRGAWPLAQPHPGAAAWLQQEAYTACPWCSRRPRDPGVICPACKGHEPLPCPACDGVPLGERAVCLWCHRSGLDPLLADPIPPIYRRRQALKKQSKGRRRQRSRS